MIGLTLGITESWREAAHSSAKRMEQATGVECIVVEDWIGEPLNHPSWLKLWLPEAFPEDDLMIFDADLLALRDWDPEELLEGHDLVWVRNQNRRVRSLCPQYGLDVSRYANSGLLLVKKGCTILQQAQQFYPEYGPWKEEVGLNEVVQKQGPFSVRLLGENYNWLFHLNKGYWSVVQGRDIVNLHLVGLQGSNLMFKFLERNLCTQNVS